MPSLLPTLMLLGALFASPLAAATTGPLSGADPGRFAAERQQIERALAEGEQYREISEPDRQAVLAALARIADLLATPAAPEREHALDQQRQQVNRLLQAAAADSKQICRRERPLGSRLPVNVCKTVAQQRREREQSRDTRTRQRD